MGECAEMCADKYHISRQQQDDHAVAAFQRAAAAVASGATAREVVPVRLPASRGSEGGAGEVSKDDALAKLNEQKLRALRPFFKKVTGWTASLLPCDIPCMCEPVHQLFSHTQRFQATSKRLLSLL